MRLEFTLSGLARTARSRHGHRPFRRLGRQVRDGRRRRRRRRGRLWRRRRLRGWRRVFGAGWRGRGDAQNGGDGADDVSASVEGEPPLLVLPCAEREDVGVAVGHADAVCAPGAADVDVRRAVVDQHALPGYPLRRSDVRREAPGPRLVDRHFKLAAQVIGLRREAREVVWRRRRRRRRATGGARFAFAFFAALGRLPRGLGCSWVGWLRGATE